MREHADSPPSADSQPSSSLQSLDHALIILEKLAAEGRDVGVLELSRRVGIPKSTVHRVLSTLRQRRYLEQNDLSGKYRLGLKVWELGCAYLGQIDLPGVARPILERLTAQSGESAHLAILDQGQAVYIHIVESAHPVRAFTRIGGRSPSHCTGTGKALLAHQPPEVIDEIIRAGLTRHSPNTIVDPDLLQQELARIRQQGYAVNNGEYREDVSSVGAPVWNHAGQVIASISTSGPGVRFTPEQMENIIGLVVRAAADISAALGYLPAGGGRL